MDPVSSSALIGAGASAISSAVGAGISGNMNHINRKWQERMMQRQQEMYFERWNAQNEYNSPEATKARYLAAGLNPSLMYSGGASGSAATQVANPSSPSGAGTSSMAPISAPISASELAGIRLSEKEGDYYSALANITSGEETVLKKSQSALNDALRAVAGENKDNISLQNGLLRLQNRVSEIDLAWLETLQENRTTLVTFQGPQGETINAPIGLLPLYLDYASTVMEMNDARSSSETLPEAIQGLKDNFRLLSLSLPEAEVQAAYNMIVLECMTDGDRKYKVTVDGKEKDVTMRELLELNYGAEVMESYDNFRSILARETRKTGFDKTKDILTLLFGATAVASSFYGKRAPRAKYGPTIYGAPSPAQARGMGMVLDGKGSPIEPRLMY